ncbi:histone H3.Y-like [Rhipicephalus sanguineus]|uniref:histone H3.Y-like n=1 Tax=Rhipicephalus sanguineus TaxID=34632 RepID=UPI001894FF85|nr:histone H3.Y-like [Rhipicephalus sanguineus]
MDDRTEAKPADNVGETVEQLGHSSASRTSGQLAPQQGAIKARRPLGLGVLREIRRLQSGVRTVIPRQAFARVVREIVQRDETGSRDLNMQRLALEALQEASEAVLVHILEGSNAIAQNAGRVTIMRRDMATVLRMIRSYGNLQLSLL